MKERAITSEVRSVNSVLREIESEGVTREEAIESALKQLNPGENEQYEV